MKTLIENYRGFDITFDTDNERFTFSLDETNWNEKTSYAACKKQIDTYLKDNATFEPFEVVTKDAQRRKIVGIRKDGKFIYEERNVKMQVLQHDEKDWMLDLPENEIHFATLASLETDREEIRKKIVETRAKIIAPTLRDLKRKYLPS